MKAAPGSARSRRDRALRHAGLAIAAAVVLMVLALMMDESTPQGTADPVRVRPDGELRLPALPPTVVGSEPALLPVGPPPPESQAASPSASMAGTPQQGAPTTDSPVPASAPEAVAAPVAPPATVSAAAAATAAAVAVADGYRVQLGVFGDPANAGNLQAELAARGMPAHIQSRVVLGPYRNRAEAERAQAQLRKAGAEAGVLVAPARKQR